MASTQSSSSSSQSTGFSGINDPQALAALQTLISQLASGGTDQQKSQASAKKAGIDQINAALGDYKKSAAFQDALDLVTASLGKAMEAQKPAITRAVQGAGTSASSMQGLLAENAAESAAVQAGALGAEQAKSYGQITASLLSTLMSATSTSDPAVSELLKALDLTKVSTQQSTSSSSSSGSSTDPAQQQQTNQGNSSGSPRSSSGGSGSTASQGSGGLFDDYDPYAHIISGSNVQSPVQYSYDDMGSPIPTYSDGTTTTYGTNPNASGYMSITNTTGSNSYSFQNTTDPYSANDLYYVPESSFSNLYGTEDSGDLYDFQFTEY